jgi:L-glutamine-phosphate cytidylyltransferase
MKAIILAAGSSKRLGKLTEQTPKCLLSLGDKTILQHQIENLRTSSLSDIVLVTGFCEEMIKRACGSACRYISNPLFATTNSIYSLWLAREEAREGFVVLNADVVFHPQLLARLLDSPYPDALAVSYHGSLGEEEMKVTVQDERVCDIGKEISPDDAQGENVGIVKFSPQGSRVLFDKIEDLVGQGIVNAWLPLAFQKICSYHSLFAVSAAGLPWIEIDFPEDLERARKEIYPQICAVSI